MQKARKKEPLMNKKEKINAGTLAMGVSLFESQKPQNLKDFINSRNGASKEVVKELDVMALEMMSAYSELHKQSDAANSPQEYVTRETKIGCSHGEYPVQLDAVEDHGVIAANGKPLLTCRDCQVNINISGFGKCFAEVKDGRKLQRSSNTKMYPVGDRWIYWCIPEPVGQWRQKESVLELGDGEDGKYSGALTAGACLTCRYGGKIEIIEVPDPEVPEVDNEETEKILPLESKWLEDHTKDMEYKKYVTLDFLIELGWTKIADYFMDEENGERSDWMKTCEDGIYRFNPDPKIVRHYRPLDEQDIININRVFMLYDITNRERICAFLSQTAYESKYGKQMCELVGEDDTENTRTAMEKYILENNFDKNGNFKYPYQYRGGGAIHTTHKGNYQKLFSEITNIWNKNIIENIATEYTGEDKNVIEEEKIISIGTEYVAYNYPWLSAGVYWKNNDLNTILETEKTDENEEEEIGILGVINIINKGSSKKEERSKEYTDCLDKYDEYVKKNIRETENE